MYAEIIDRAFQEYCDQPEATEKCEFCKGATPVSMLTALDNVMSACPVCDEKEQMRLRELRRDIDAIILTALTERQYTEQDGKRWTGRQSIDVVAERIRAAVERAVEA